MVAPCGHPLVLSIFPGIDLLGRAFAEEGFCVVRGPDLLWGGDIKTFHPPTEKFDGVIGGDPCQSFSLLSSMNETQGIKPRFPDMTPEFERIIKESHPAWFLRENVTQAPDISISNYFISKIKLNNRWFGAEQNRLRAFWFGCWFSDISPWSYLDVTLLESIKKLPTMLAGHGLSKGQRKIYHRQTWTIAEMCEAQGLSPNLLDSAPFTLQGKQSVIGNGVPLPMGRAVAKAIKKAMYER